MSDYRGNFYSTDAYNPTYSVSKITSGVQLKMVTAAEVTADKALIGSGYLDDVESAATIGVVYRASGSTLTALPTNFSIEKVVDAGSNPETYKIYLKGNANYTLTANDVFVYINSAFPIPA